MSSSSPALSIYLSSYNYGRYIGAAIESILGQSFGDYELIIVDNASVDHTREVVTSYHDTRVQLVFNERNMGSEYSANVFAERARGKYLRTLCADDVLLGGVLEDQVRILNRYSMVTLATCNMLATDEHLENRVLVRMFPGYASSATVIGYCLHNLENALGGPSNFMYRRTARKSLEPLREYRFVGDVKFAMMLLEGGGDYMNTDAPGYLYRRHSASDTHVGCPPEVQARDWLRLIMAHDELCHLNCSRLLRSRLDYTSKRLVARWLVRNLFYRRSLSVSWVARKKQWVLTNQ